MVYRSSYSSPTPLPFLPQKFGRLATISLHGFSLRTETSIGVVLFNIQTAEHRYRSAGSRHDTTWSTL